MNQQKRRVVVTGLGTINPLGNDVSSTWQKISNGQSGIDTITSFDVSAYKTTFAGEVKGFDPKAHFDRKEVRRLSRMTQFALFAAQQAIEDANLTVTEENKPRIGVVVGSGMGSLDPIIDNVNMFNKRGPYRVSPFFVPMMLADTPAATVAIHHGLGGPNMSVATACATGNDAVGQAARVVQHGAADVMIAGSSEACLMPLAFAGFSVMKALSTRNDTPQTACRPFDKTRDGFVVSEGAAMLVLESLEHAQARGARIYGEFLGYGASADAYHISMPAPDGSGAIEAIRAALDDAAVEPTAVNYISAHGTSTALNDKAETAAIKAVFGEAAYDVAVSSTKSMHGHLLGGSGSLEAIICLQAIQHNLLPPTINYETADPDCDLDYVPNTARPAQVDITMSNGFGLGGHNATLVMGRYNN